MRSARDDRTGSWDRKISKTLLDFAAPLLKVMPADASQEDFEKVLRVAVTVWNSVVFDYVNADDHYATQVRRLISRSPGTGLLVNRLIARKRTRFGRDRRLIGGYKVTLKEGQLNLWMEARAPRSRS